MVVAPTRSVVHAVIVGAGPGGLLTAINLLLRNQESTRVTYKVTLVDPAMDYGTLDERGLEKKRSWMIGLSAHGIAALKSVPGLFERVQASAVSVSKGGIHIAGRKLIATVAKEGEAYNIDRNFICARMAAFLRERFAPALSDGSLELKYFRKALFVDGSNRSVLLRPTGEEGGEDEYQPYDLLIGADGVRSVVRDALVHADRDFEVTVRDIFTPFKAAHLALPEDFDSTVPVHLFPGTVPGMNGIGLLEKNGKMNFNLGHLKSNNPPPELLSEDPKLMAGLLEKHLGKTWPGFDWIDCANQFIAQEWNTTGQVTCNKYHNSSNAILILGDAAHATSPAIGQGMNTALDDARALSVLLHTHSDDLKQVLPTFSEERVKEGNALTFLSAYAYSTSPMQQTRIMLEGAVRGYLHRVFPSIAKDPIQSVGEGVKLSAAYDMSVQLGNLPQVRRLNEEARLAHFERATGMVTSKVPRIGFFSSVGIGALAILGASVCAAVGL